MFLLVFLLLPFLSLPFLCFLRLPLSSLYVYITFFFNFSPSLFFFIYIHLSIFSCFFLFISHISPPYMSPFHFLFIPFSLYYLFIYPSFCSSLWIYSHTVLFFPSFYSPSFFYFLRSSSCFCSSTFEGNSIFFLLVLFDIVFFSL